jgi:hypothetical protein
MFTVEIKINGSMISHVYGHNEGLDPEGSGDTVYRWEYYHPSSRELKHGQVLHHRDEGIEPLICKILSAQTPAG